MLVSRPLQAVLILTIAAVFLFGLGSSPLTERSEARYAGVAWEMVNSGDYLIPRYNGIEHFHKPPLCYWAMALSMKAFGSTELAARIPIALAAFGVLALSFGLGREFTTRAEGGWLTLGFLSASPFFWEMGRVAVTDMLVAFFVALSLAAAWKLLTGPPSKSAFGLFWVSLGLNFLTKGPVGPLIVGLVLVPYIWRCRCDWKVFRPLLGLLIATAIGLPWYLYVVAQNPGLLSYFLVLQTVDRVFTNIHHRDGPFWFYLPVILGGFLPFSWLLPAAIKDAWSKVKATEPSQANPDLFLLLWALLPVLFFSAITSKLPPYVLPMFPALALLMVRALPNLKRTWLFGLPITLLLTGLFALLEERLFAIERLQRFVPDFQVAGWWLLLGGAVTLILWLRGQAQRVVWAAILTVWGLQGVAGRACAKLDYLTAKPMAQAVREHAKGEFEVAMFRWYLFGLPYYTGQLVVHVEHPREVQFHHDETYKSRYYEQLNDYLPVFRKGDKDRFLVVSWADWATVQPLLTESVIFSDDKYRVLWHPKEAALPK